MRREYSQEQGDNFYILASDGLLYPSDVFDGNVSDIDALAAKINGEGDTDRAILAISTKYLSSPRLQFCPNDDVYTTIPNINTDSNPWNIDHFYGYSNKAWCDWYTGKYSEATMEDYGPGKVWHTTLQCGKHCYVPTFGEFNQFIHSGLHSTVDISGGKWQSRWQTTPDGGRTYRKILNFGVDNNFEWKSKALDTSSNNIGDMGTCTVYNKYVWCSAWVATLHNRANQLYRNVSAEWPLFVDVRDCKEGYKGIYLPPSLTVPNKGVL